MRGMKRIVMRVALTNAMRCTMGHVIYDTSYSGVVSLRHAILGLLSTRPMSGYDLKTQCFDGSIAHFWPADQSQIYRTLEQLADADLLSVHVEDSDQGPARKVYTVTDAGNDELARWLQSDLAPPAIRDATLVQLFFSDGIAPEHARRHLQAWKAEYQGRLAVYEAIPLPPLQQRAGTQWERQRMTLDLGIAHARMCIDWAERCLEYV